MCYISTNCTIYPSVDHQGGVNMADNEPHLQQVCRVISSQSALQVGCSEGGQQRPGDGFSLEITDTKHLC